MKNHSKIKAQYIYLLGYAVYLISYFIAASALTFVDNSTKDSITQVLRYCAYGLFLMYFFCIYKKILKLHPIRMLCILGILAIVSANSGDASLLFCFTCVFLSHGIEYKRIFKLSFYLTVICWVIVVIGVPLGMTENIIRIDAQSGINRYSLGFSNQNIFSAFAFVLVLEFLMYRWGRITSFNVLVMELLNIIVFLIARTDTVFLILLVMPPVFLIAQKSTKFKERLCKLSVYSVPICAALSITACSLFYKLYGKTMIVINMILSGRIQLGANGIRDWGFTALGQKIEWNPESWIYNNIDNFYVRVAVEWGVIALALIVVAYVVFAKKASNNLEYEICIGVLFMGVYAILENRLALLGFNPFVFSFGIYQERISQQFKKEKYGNIIVNELSLFFLHPK